MVSGLPTPDSPFNGYLTLLARIPAGDLGLSPDKVEINLERFLSLANAWECVLLLDEADVFLTKRSKEDVARNGLVSGRKALDSPCLQTFAD